MPSDDDWYMLPVSPSTYLADDSRSSPTLFSKNSIDKLSYKSMWPGFECLYIGLFGTVLCSSFRANHFTWNPIKAMYQVWSLIIFKSPLQYLLRKNKILFHLSSGSKSGSWLLMTKLNWNMIIGLVISGIYVLPISFYIRHIHFKMVCKILLYLRIVSSTILTWRIFCK